MFRFTSRHTLPLTNGAMPDSLINAEARRLQLHPIFIYVKSECGRDWTQYFNSIQSSKSLGNRNQPLALSSCTFLLEWCNSIILFTQTITIKSFVLESLKEGIEGGLSNLCLHEGVVECPNASLQNASLKYPQMDQCHHRGWQIVFAACYKMHTRWLADRPGRYTDRVSCWSYSKAL